MKICRGITNSNKSTNKKVYIIIGVCAALILIISLFIIVFTIMRHQRQIKDYIKNNESVQITILDTIV